MRPRDRMSTIGPAAVRWTHFADFVSTAGHRRRCPAVTA